MKIFVAFLILAGAYVVTFGLPLPDSSQSQGGASSSAGSPQGSGGGRRGGTTTAVALGMLEARPYTNILRSIGSAESLDNTTVVSSGNGTITSLSMLANSTVEVGDVLLQLDNENERLALEIAKATLLQATSTVQRYTNIERSGVSEMVLQQSRVDEQLAKAQVNLAQLAYDERTIRAPISGNVGLTEVNLGDTLSESDEIVTIDNTRILVAEFEVPERAIGMVTKGTPVLINTPVYTGRIFNGEITEFDSRLDDVTRSVTVRANIDNSEGKLWAGMTFAIRMINETQPLPSVEATAVSWDRGGAGIWTVENDTAKRIPITILYRNGDLVWVETDIPVGSPVVIEGALKLRNGLKVQDVNRSPAQTANTDQQGNRTTSGNTPITQSGSES